MVLSSITTKLKVVVLVMKLFFEKKEIDCGYLLAQFYPSDGSLTRCGRMAEYALRKWRIILFWEF
jgi:hypothetical protein